MSDGVYEHDLLVWSEQQADLLDRLAAGEPVNECLDWPNLIEEVRDLDLSELKLCRSWITLTIQHPFKLKAAPDSRDAQHWADEIDHFLSDLQNHFTPSMAQRIDIGQQYAKARRKFAGSGGTRLPAECPFKLDDLLDESAAVPGLLAKLDVPGGN